MNPYLQFCPTANPARATCDLLNLLLVEDLAGQTVERIETRFLGSKPPSSGTNQPLETAKNLVSKRITL
jgi:hypothetical protein